jgi:hypothetical protein
MIVSRCGTPGPTRVPDWTVRTNSTRAKRWLREILQLRIRLADRGLSRAQQRELWHIVDVREWGLRILIADFHAELERIDREIEDALRR